MTCGLSPWSRASEEAGTNVSRATGISRPVTAWVGGRHLTHSAALAVCTGIARIINPAISAMTTRRYRKEFLSSVTRGLMLNHYTAGSFLVPHRANGLAQRRCNERGQMPDQPFSSVIAHSETVRDRRFLCGLGLRLPHGLGFICSVSDFGGINLGSLLGDVPNRPRSHECHRPLGGEWPHPMTHLPGVAPTAASPSDYHRTRGFLVW